MIPEQPERFVLVLRPERGNWRFGPIARLRGLLKAALRGYGFRCVDIKVIEPGPKAESK